MIMWPKNKDFAFTIIDDTDNAYLKTIKPVYDLLFERNIITTKTVWVYPSRDHFYGHSLSDHNYLKFIKSLQKKGFEIQLHNVGSGSFSRKEILEGMEVYKDLLGEYPTMHINHSKNPDNMYWDYKRHAIFLRSLCHLGLKQKLEFYGDEADSDHFWGDFVKKQIKYIRNRDFHEINTLKMDPRMPYREKNKPYSNYWFSSSIGDNVQSFNNLISKKNVDKLIHQNGLCIVYTHFGAGFVDHEGHLNKEFVKNINYLSHQNGWFAPASQILDFLLSQPNRKSASELYLNYIDLKKQYKKIIYRYLKK